MRLTVIALTICLTPLVADAQFPGPPSRRSTEDFRRGLESVIRSAGQSKSDVPTSPLVDYQNALSQSYDNQIKAVHTKYERRKLHREYRKAELQRNVSPKKGPQRLSTAQFDARTGRIKWPAVFNASAQRTNRQRVDKLFAAHLAAGGGVDTAQYAEIYKRLNAMKTQLRKDIRDMPPEQYSSAKKFLDSLRDEARYPRN